MILRPLDEGLWAVEQWLRLPGGLQFPARSTVVRLPDGGLWILSPVPVLPRLARQLEALGPVRALVSPNLLHHQGLIAAQRAFPQARVFGRPGLEKKRPDVKLTDTLGVASDPLWAGVLEQVAVGGIPRLNEVAFFHIATRSLLLGDLVFNLQELPHGPTRFLMQLNDAYQRFGPSRFTRALMKDKAAVRIAVERMLAWAPERIVPCHGDIVPTGGRAVLEEAFASFPR